MDGLFNELMRQVALQGRKGCSVNELWNLVAEELPIKGIQTLGPTLKNHLWKLLLERNNDIALYISRQSLSSEIFDEITGNQRDKSDIAKLPLDLEELQDMSYAIEINVIIKIMDGYRDCVLNIYDAQTSRFKMSEKQIEALEIVAASKRNGALQSEVARALNIAHRNFHYVAKHLENRDTVIRNPIIVLKENEDKSFASTRIMHLIQYSPSVKLFSHFQSFKEISDDEKNDDDVRTTACYKMIDDAEWMQKICEAIELTETKTVLEFDLKKVFGFRKTRGHRSWRRIRKKMVDGGLISCFVGKVNGTPYSCLKLLQNFDEWWDKYWEVENKKLPLGSEKNVTIESSIDRQIFGAILEAGREGITTKEICERIGINLKFHSKRIQKMKKSYGIEMKMDMKGRVHVNRCIAPLAAIQEKWENNSNSHIVSENKDNIKQEVQEHTLPSTSPTNVTPNCEKFYGISQYLDIQTTNSHPNKRLKSCNVNNAVEDTLDDSAFLTASPDRSGDQKICVNSSSVSEKQLKDFLFINVVVTRNEFRIRSIVDKLNKEKFVMLPQVSAFLRDREIAAGLEGHPHNGPDRKSTMRLADEVVRSYGAQKLKLSIVTKKCGPPKLIDVLVRNDVPVTESLIQEIGEAASMLNKEFRQKCCVKTYAKILELNGKEIPDISELQRLPVQAEENIREKHRALSQRRENGYLIAKMVRVKLLHMLICRLVGLGGFNPTRNNILKDTQMSFEIPYPSKLNPIGSFNFNINNSDKNYIFSKSFFNDALPVKKKDKAASDVVLSSSTSTYSFTPRLLWDFMPISIYLQIVGSSADLGDTDTLQRKYGTMADLPLDIQKLLIDDHSQIRLSVLLDILCKIGLLKGIHAASASSCNLQAKNCFTASSIGILEEPVCGESDTEDEMDTFDTEKPVRKKRLKFNLKNKEELEDYWAKMEYIFTKKREMAFDCHPAPLASEVYSMSGWKSERLMTLKQWKELNERMDEERGNIDAEFCRNLSEELNLDYYQILHLSYAKRKKYEQEMYEYGLKVRKFKTKRKLYKLSKPRSKRPKVVKQLAILPIKENSEKTDKMDNDNLIREILKVKLLDDKGDLVNNIIPLRFKDIGTCFDQEDDRKLISSFFTWRCSTRRGINPKWCKLLALPCSYTSEGFDRMRRRFRYLRTKPELMPLFEECEALAENIYQGRLERLSKPQQDVVGGIIDQAQSYKKYHNHSSESNMDINYFVKRDESGSDTISEDDDLDIKPDHKEILIRRLQGMDALQILLQTSHPDDKQTVKKMMLIVEKIGQLAPRQESPEGMKMRMRQGGANGNDPLLAQRRDLGSKIVLTEQRGGLNRRFAFRLKNKRLSSCPFEFLSLSKSMAKEYILSALYLSEKHEFLTRDMAIQITSRFTDEDILSALGFMHKEGWMVGGNSKCPVLLSSHFIKEIKFSYYDKSFFENVIMTDNALHRILTGQKISEDHKSPLAKAICKDFQIILNDSIITGPVVAAVLAQLFCSFLNLEVATDYDIAKRQKSLLDDDDDDNGKGMGPLTPIINLVVNLGEVDPEMVNLKDLLATSSDIISERPLTQSRNCTGSAGIIKNENVLDSPSKVAVCSEARERAEQNLKRSLEDVEGSGMVWDKLLDILRKAKGDGVTPEAAFIQMKGSSDIPVELGAERLVDVLKKVCNYGLARKVPGFDSEVFVASEYSQNYFFENTGLPIRPWVDCNGQLNKEFIKMLQERVLTIVTRFPGARESFLVDQLKFLNPQNARDFLQAMVEEDLIFVEEVEKRQESQVPTIFNTSSSSNCAAKQEKTAFTRFYFLNLHKCYQKELPVTEKLQRAAP